MTKSRRSKRAIRSHMEQTGEKYTQARRAILASGGGGGGEDPGVGSEGPQDALAWFTDQAYNAILLGDDEARMLSHATVEPEHLLLAVARRGNVEGLLEASGVGARKIHETVVRVSGFGEKLELRPQRSEASRDALRRAVLLAAERGVLGPSTEHLLIALGEHATPAQILDELGIADVRALVDATYPATRPPLDGTVLERRAAGLAAIDTSPPSPGPIPPIFERFSGEARAAIQAAIKYAGESEDQYVEPVHLLLGALNVRGGVVATVRAQRGWNISPARFLEPGHERGTDIFTTEARRIVAEELLLVAERLGHRALTSGHLLIATLESGDGRVRELANLLPGAAEITAAVIDCLARGEDD